MDERHREAAKMEVLRVGSRSSELAMIQTRTVIAALQRAHPGLECTVTTMATIGDKILDKALPSIGQTNLFTKELEAALAAGQVDLIVHSLKDLPTTLPPGMHIAAICERDSPTDALVLHPKHRGATLGGLPPGSVIGTSSLRRIAQLKHHFPGLVFKTVRGNLNTRLRKLDEGGDYDALVLATAGLVRMGWEERISEELLTDVCLYAVGQGALAVETRSDDAKTTELVSLLNHAETVLCCASERAFLRTLGGGCSVPVGVVSNIQANELHLKGAVFSLDGSKVLSSTSTAKLPASPSSLPLAECHSIAERLGTDLAGKLMSLGAEPILAQAKREVEAGQNN